MAENRSINILVNLIDNVSDKADNIQRKLNGLENRKKAYEKAEKDGDKKRAAELRKSYKEDREAALAELEKLNKQKEKYLSRLASEEAKERDRSVKAAQKESDSKLKIAEKEAEARATLAKAERAEREQAARASTLRVAAEERKATLAYQKELDRRNSLSRNASRVRAAGDIARIQAEATRETESIRNEARAENRRLIRQENELIKIQRQQQIEYERTATFMGRARYQTKLLGDESNRLTVRLSRVGLAVRGVVVANALVFARALISVFVALAGQAVALAGSLVYAAGALGGAFVAAASQALPVIGLLGAAMSRLSIIQEAVNQNDLMQKQQFGDTGAAGAASDAAQQVADAQDAVKEAQENLTKARQDAKRELRDLILSEKEAELAFKRSGLSQKEARAALKERISTGEGSYLEFQSDMLAVPEARLSRRRSRNELTDTRQDLAKALKGGIEGMEGVKNATKALASAQRQLAQAQASASSGMDSQSAAASNLQFFLSQLTPTERKIYKAFIGFRDRFREVMSSVTDILFKSVLGSFGKIEKAIFNPRLLSGFKNLSRSIGGAFKELIGVVTSKESLNFWDKTLGRAASNIKPLTSIAKSLYKIFMNIADAAGPAFKEILSLINGEFKKFEKTTNNKKGVRAFFDTGIKQLKAWGRLIGSVIELFAELFGASSESALNTLDDLTKRIDKATAWIRENPKQVQEFFMATSVAFGYLLDIVEHVGAAMLRLFDADTIETFSIIVDDVLIPALVGAIETFAVVVELFEAFIRIPFVPQVLAMLGAVKIFTGSLGLLLALLKSLVMPLWRFANVLFPAATASMKAFFAAENWSYAALKETFKKAAREVLFFVQYVKSTNVGQAFVNAWNSTVTPFFANVFPKRFRGFLGGRLKGIAGKVGKGAGIIFAAAMLAGLVDSLSDGKFFIKFEEFSIKLVALLVDAFEAGINIIIGGLNKLIDLFNKVKPGPDISPVQEVDFGMGERAKEIIFAQKLKTIEEEINALRASGNAKTSEAVRNRIKGLEKERESVINRYRKEKELQQSLEKGKRALGGADVSPITPRYDRQQQRRMFGPDLIPRSGDEKRTSKETKEIEKNTEAKKENAKATMRLANRQEDSATATRKAARRQSEQREEVKRNRFQQALLGNKLEENKDAQNKFDKATSRATKQSDSQRKGAKKLSKGLGSLDKVVRGVGGNSRGLGKIFGDVTNKVLSQFGVKKLSFSLPSVESVFEAATDIVGGAFAEGGYFGDKSLRNRDDRLIAVAGGEAILTGYHQPEVNKAMAFANAYGVSRFNSLDSMFSGEKRPHYTAPGYNTGGRVPGFATGGYPGLTGDLDFGVPLGRALSRMAISTGTPIYVQDGGRTMAEQAILYQRWLDGTGNLAAAPNANAPHIRGIAADITPGSEVFGSVAGRFGLGFTVPGESWHIELLSGESFGMGGAGMVAPQIKKIEIKGPDGPYKSMLTGEEKVLREAANEYLKANLPTDEGGTLPISVQNIEDFSAINRIFPEHNSAYGDWGGTKLPFNLVAALAQAVGLPGITFAQIAIGESGLRPGATGIDPGGTKGLGLWMITTGYNDELIAQFGGQAQMRNPVKNAMAAKMIYDSQGTGAWYGTGFVTDFNNPYTGKVPSIGRKQTGGEIPEFNDGGVVPGRMGEPVIARVHAGETILPTHRRFAGGGNVPSSNNNNADKEWQKDWKKGEAKEDDKKKEWTPKPAEMFTKGFLGGLEELSAAFRGISVALTKSEFAKKSKTIKEEIKNLDKRLEKFFDAIGTAGREFEELVTDQTRKLNLWAYKVIGGYASQVKTTEQISQRELENLKQQSKYLRNQERMIENTYRDLQKEFKGTDKEQKKLRQKLRFAMRKARGEMQNIQDKMIENIQAQIEAQRTAFDEAMAKFDVKRSILDVKLRIQEALGEVDMKTRKEELQKQLDEAKAAGDQGRVDELTKQISDIESGKNPNQQAMIDLINQDTNVLQAARKRIQKDLAKARKAGDQQRVDELTQQLLDNQLAIIENNLRIKELTEATEDNTETTEENTQETFNFTSTAWDKFRFAVLQGTGVSPDLTGTIPQMASGGFVSREGLAYLHSAEVVVPAGQADKFMSMGSGGPLVENINFTQPMEVADPIAVSNQIGFKLSTLKSL